MPIIVFCKGETHTVGGNVTVAIGLKRGLIGFAGLLIATALSAVTPLVKKQASQESIRFLGSLLFIGIVILNRVRTLV